MSCELSVIIPTHRRNEKLRTLVEGLASTPHDHEAFEVVVVVDGEDPTPLDVAHRLPESIRFVGLTKPHGGPAAARNFAIDHARGDWILFYDDDIRVDADTIPGHLRRIREAPDACCAHLGRVEWPHELIDSRWSQLLARSSMLFFWDRMSDHQSYGFRHFWTSNLSVRRDLVRDVGGFNEGFPSAMHEDIELGYRLHASHGVDVRVDRSIACVHDHALSPRDYFRREHCSGRSARAARDLNRAFHDQVWPWLTDPDRLLDARDRLLGHGDRGVLRLLESWAQPSDARLTEDECVAGYHAQLPLKRRFFLEGYLERDFDSAWDALAMPDDD